MRYFFHILAFLFFFGSTNGQFYNTGQSPASVKWMQIRTEKFQIIYPLGFYKEANRVAIILDYMYEYIGADLNNRPKRVSILLYNQSTLSNGFVVWAPKRAEWITTPPLDTYAQDWLEQLALHEFRHVVQIDKLEQGFTKMLKIIFGEMAVGAVSAFLPLWFLEGDAVLSETSLSSTGRGRQPDFSMEIRAIELEREKRYTYDQSYLGSYKYFIPDHYKYGYQIVSYGKLKYGSKLWSNTIDNIAQRPFSLAPYFFGLKKNGATSKVTLYNETFDSLKLLWNNSINNINDSNTLKIFTPPAKHFTNYLYPQQTKNGLFTVKTGLADITRFVLIKDSSEMIIHTPGRYYNTPVQVNDNYIVWEETIPDIRWQKCTYSVIKLFDRRKGKERMLANKTRYFYPVISPDERKIACIEISRSNRYSIVLLSVPNGKELKKIQFNEGMHIQGIAWLGDDRLIYISMTNDGKFLQSIDLRTGQSRILYHSGFINIAHPVYTGDNILFTQDTEISRNIYAYSLTDGKIRRITSTKYGAAYPSYDSITGNIIYSDYTISGYRPVSIQLERTEKILLDEIETYKYPWSGNISEKAASNLQESDYNPTQFDSARYRRFLHAINIHSWSPFYFDIDDFSAYEPAIYPGITVLSQNKLSTVTSSLSYYYSGGYHYFKPKVTLEGLYPVFEVAALFRSSPGAISYDRNLPGLENIHNYYEFHARSYLPLNFSRNKYARFFQPGIEYLHENVYYLKDSINYLGYDYLKLSMFGSHLLKKSYRDLYPRYGQTLFLSINRSLKDPTSFGSKTLAILNLYFPGVFPNHSIRLYLAHEKNENTVHMLRPQAFLPRGFHSDITRYTEILSGKFEYTFPFLYPDWSIGPIAYIKRFHASLFYDVASISYSQETNSIVIDNKFIVSLGTTIAAEMNFIRFFVPFTPRLTISYLPDGSFIDFRFGISINSQIL